MIICGRGFGSCLVFALLALSLSTLMGADATVEVRVVDDLGNVVPGARVIAGWNLPREPGNGSGVGRGAGVSGTTDKEGLVSLSVQGVPGIEVSMDGHYQNGIDGMDVMPKYFTNPIFSLNMIKCEVTISRVIRPVPMYVRSVRTKIPSLDGKDCGFDLELGDWVAPNGKGTTSDFVIRVIHKESEPRDWDQEGVIGFTSPNDGIIKVAVQKNTWRRRGLGGF